MTDWRLALGTAFAVVVPAIAVYGLLFWAQEYAASEAAVQSEEARQ